MGKSNSKYPLKGLLKKAVNGDAESQYKIGVSFLKNKDKIDIKTAFYWIEKSAHNGYSKALHNLGTCYLKGIGCTKDADIALEYYVRAYQRGYKQSAVAIFNLYDKGLVKNDNKLISYYWELVKEDNNFENFGPHKYLTILRDKDFTKLTGEEITILKFISEKVDSYVAKKLYELSIAKDEYIRDYQERIFIILDKYNRRKLYGDAVVDYLDRLLKVGDYDATGRNILYVLKWCSPSKKYEFKLTSDQEKLVSKLTLDDIKQDTIGVALALAEEGYSNVQYFMSKILLEDKLMNRNQLKSLQLLVNSAVNGYEPAIKAVRKIRNDYVDNVEDKAYSRDLISMVFLNEISEEYSNDVYVFSDTVLENKKDEVIDEEKKTKKVKANVRKFRPIYLMLHINEKVR